MFAGDSLQIKPDDLAENIALKLPGFKISGQDFKTPTKKFVVDYFTAVVEEFGVNFDKLNHLPDVSHEVKLYHILSYIFTKLNIKFFSFDCLVNPDPKLTLMLFTIMDNFHSFADNQALEVVSKLQERRVARQTAFQQLTMTKNELLQQENQRAVERATMLKQTTHELQEHTKQLKASKIAAMEKQRKLVDNKKNAERKLMCLKTSLDDYIKATSDMKEKRAQLERQIVTQSPEELQQELEDLQAKVSARQQDLGACSSKLLEKDQQISLLRLELAGVQEMNHNLQQAWTLQAQVKELSASVQVIQGEIQSVKADSKLIHQQISKCKEERARLKKLHDETELNVEKKIRAFEDNLRKLKQELDQLLKSQEEENAELSDVNEQISVVLQKKEEEINMIKQEKEEFENAKKRYEQKVKLYTEEILKGLKNLNDSLNQEK